MVTSTKDNNRTLLFRKQTFIAQETKDKKAASGYAFERKYT